MSSDTRACNWAGGNRFIGDCDGPVTHEDHAYMFNGSAIYACTHHAKASYEMSPMAGYDWKMIKGAR